MEASECTDHRLGQWLLILLNSLAPGGPKLIPTLNGNCDKENIGFNTFHTKLLKLKHFKRLIMVFSVA